MELTSDAALLRKELTKMPNVPSIRAMAKKLSTMGDGAKLKEACDGFEELFVHKMLQVMRESSGKSGLIFGGRGEEIFQDMLDENYAKLITRTGALGLSGMIYEHTKEYL